MLDAIATWAWKYWLDIKTQICSNLATFKTALGEEHMQRLGETGNLNAFICKPVATRE
jgi:hypothetical protein